MTAPLAIALITLGFSSFPAGAHVSERALVLLLPTDIYIRSGVIAVALTVALLFLLPPRFFDHLFRGAQLNMADPPRISHYTSLLALGFIAFLIYAGFAGSRDPLANPLPVFIWSIWWIVLPVASAFLGNLFAYLNPWRGVADVWPERTRQRVPPHWAPLAILLLFSTFVVADIAPDDPDRLASIVLGYLLFTFAMIGIFGPVWLTRGEPFSIYFRELAQLSPVWIQDGLRAGFPGARLVLREVPLTLAFVIIAALGAGTFDGLNETFWWLGLIGINPLEFPGRSAVAVPNTIGLLTGILLLGLVFALLVWCGLAMTGRRDAFAQLFPKLTLSLLPIALGYHIAHYLTSFLVGVQYALKTATDPFGQGHDLLGLGQFYVTTSFFNVPETVEMIWLTQASAIVIGHVLAVLIAHGIALEALGSHKKATISQLPVAAFMVVYTFFGLWILAQPTGA